MSNMTAIFTRENQQTVSCKVFVFPIMSSPLRFTVMLVSKLSAKWLTSDMDKSISCQLVCQNIWCGLMIEMKHIIWGNMPSTNCKRKNMYGQHALLDSCQILYYIKMLWEFKLIYIILFKKLFQICVTDRFFSLNENQQVFSISKW